LADGYWKDGVFTRFIEVDLQALEQAFAERVLAQLHKRELITDDDVVQILSQDHTGFGVWMGDPFHDKESEQFVARYIELAPLSLEKLSIPDFAEATSGHFRRREGPAKASMATAGKTTSSPTQPKTGSRMSSTLWNFLRRFQLTSRKATSLSPDIMEGTPLGAEVNAPSSPLLPPRNKRVTIDVSSVKVVGPRASSVFMR
jgi:hypothetical protein